MSIRPSVAYIGIASIIVALTLSESPAQAAPLSCVQRAYNHLNTTPTGWSRSVKMSLTGMWGGNDGSGTATERVWTYFVKNFLVHQFNSSLGGQILKGSPNHSPFQLTYDDSGASGYWTHPSQPFDVVAIPVDDGSPVRLSVTGTTLMFYGTCTGGATAPTLTGTDQYGYHWTIGFTLYSTRVN
ncbi:MAG: hypothetical protein KF850_04145 [Labilithrix sp.]|nr:hypothetical protein [Labilithrix sp.]